MRDMSYFEALRRNRGQADYRSPAGVVTGLARRDPVTIMTPCYAAVALAYFGLSAAVFLHSDMNFFRSLPCKLLPSASFEHSRDAVVRGGLSAFFSAGAAFVAGAAAGAAVCANAELIRSRDATAVAAAREDIVIMGNTSD
jgi:hypothetical protein